MRDSRSPARSGMEEMARRVSGGDRLALARAITLVENEDRAAGPLLRALSARGRRSHRIGVTGPPGAGKSTLVGCIAQAYRARGEATAVIAVDPSSPFTGGAILADRVRMAPEPGDDGLFIRSMASRGEPGGLSARTYEASEVFEAAGFGVILIETVGAGQGELLIAEMADTTVVVLVPESGDAVQVMKAGMMEIGEIFVVNKADRDGAGALVREITHRAGGRAQAWHPPVLQTVATEGKGVEELVAALESHRAFLAAGGEGLARLQRKMEQRIRRLVEASLLAEAWSRPGLHALLEERARDAADGTLTAYEAAADLLTRARASEPSAPPQSSEVDR